MNLTTQTPTNAQFIINFVEPTTPLKVIETFNEDGVPVTFGTYQEALRFACELYQKDENAFKGGFVNIEMV
tara:strand:- start:616 stop:828 length:213 start_codon:yes stop_codon:yes gene_type:complete